MTVRAEAADGKVSLGSGVIFDADADILTALHVVSDAAKITVTFVDGSTYEARIFARQPDNDIAGIRALGHPDQMAVATLGNANALNVASARPVVSAMTTMLDCHSWPETAAIVPASSATARSSGNSSRTISAVKTGTSAPITRLTACPAREIGPMVSEVSATRMG